VSWVREEQETCDGGKMERVDADDLASVLDGIGPRVRAARRARRLTLDAVAAATGITTSTLSRLETGRRRPTLELLIPLADTLHVALDDLVAPPSTGDPRVHLRPTRRPRGDVIVPLTPHPGRVKAYKQILAPRELQLVTHPGDEWLYVLSGRLRLVVGEDDRVLRAGEIAEFDTGTPHWFGPADDHVVELLHLTRRDGA
jgi:transcriptional regulator with XRE-family HTH domain